MFNCIYSVIGPRHKRKDHDQLDSNLQSKTKPKTFGLKTKTMTKTVTFKTKDTSRKTKTETKTVLLRSRPIKQVYCL